MSEGILREQPELHLITDAGTTNFNAKVGVNEHEIVIQAPMVPYGGELLTPNNLVSADDFMRRSPDVARLLSFGIEIDEQNATLRSPNVAGLNAGKQRLVDAGTGVNDGEFVTVDEDIIGGDTYLGLIAKGKIPVAQHLIGAAHDAEEHTMGFSVMSQRVFDTLVKAAQKAIKSGKPRDWEDAIDFIDRASTALVMDGGESVTLIGLYPTFQSGVAGAARKHKDQKAQDETIVRVRAFAQQELANQTA